MPENKRVLIFIVAFNAEKHIENVLSRIPTTLFTSYDYEILIIDDSSSDDTFKIARLYQSLHQDLNLKVLFNPENLGYGGNQKLGYHYAIQHGFDVVVLLHGDGQYAPELLEEMIKPILEGRADVVLGSRMLQPNNALLGGMPLYKYVGNKILTFFQNKLLKTCLSEFHSGYRAYAVQALQSIPFERNSPDFHFDTQILIQALLKKLIILEIPIPTYYGDEICHVNGLKYAGNVLKTTILSRAHQYSILYQREYDLDNASEQYTPKFGYASSHTRAIEAVKPGAVVMEIGCNQGYLAKELRTKGCYVVGIDLYPLKHPEFLDEFYQLDLEHSEQLPDMQRFDTILLLDVIEHLGNPENFIDNLSKKAHRKCPTVIITVPNIAFFVIRFQLLFAQFNYGKQGILDLTHKRLFTFQSLRKLCESSGGKILKVSGIPAPFPKVLGQGVLGMSLLRLNEGLIHLSKSLFSYQIYMEVRLTPVVSELLAYAVTESQVERES